MSNSNFGQWVSQSHAGRILLIAILIIILQVPINSIEGLVFERKATQATGISEVQQKWGQEQRIIGPLLVVPYKEKRSLRSGSSGPKESRVETKYATFLPDVFEASNQLVNETRYRGIFEVPLYQASVKLVGNFGKPDFDAWNIKDDDILWDKARLVVTVSDARAIQKQAILNWNGSDYYFAPGTDVPALNSEGYHVDLSNFSSTATQHTFSIQLLLNGSNGLYLAPLGKDSLVKINAPWPDPSFQGKWLPTSRQINDEDFSANWQIPYLGRNFPQQSQNFVSIYESINRSLIGVDLISPVDNYRMTERSIKYVILFLVLTFVVIWLIEVLSKLRVHILQYLFIGTGLCVFYLLELSLSEHVGFYWAYVIATFAIVSLVSAYSFVVLHSGKRTAIVCSSLIGMYLYLFTLLQEQNNALLIGSIGLFIMLGIIMYVTRHIDWFKLTQMSMPAQNSQSPEET